MKHLCFLLAVLFPALALAQPTPLTEDGPAANRNVKITAAGTGSLSLVTPGAGLINFVTTGSSRMTVAATGGVSIGGALAVTGQVNRPLFFPAAQYETVAAAAAGAGVQGEGPLTADKFLHAITAANDTKVVTLPACAAGDVTELHFLQNLTANAKLRVFPALGAAINALGANTVYESSSAGDGGKFVACLCRAANTWACG